MRMRYLALILIAMCAAFITNVAYAKESTEEFIQKALIGNQFEIESSRIALQRSQNSNVKQFAQQMIDDHTQVGTQMKSVLSTAGITDAQPTQALDSNHQEMIDSLNKADKDDFDKKYVKAQVDAHDDAVKLFRKYAENGDNADLKAFAQQTLPTLQHHQAEAKNLKSSL